MKITFLGTNGWYDTPTGNTICTLVETKKYNLVLDAGNGIYKLENYFNPQKPVLLFISHPHIDHIEGLHILCKFRKMISLDIYCYEKYYKDIFNFANQPFTVPLEKIKVQPTKLHGLTLGKHQLPFPMTVKLLTHSADSIGYRLEIDGKIVSYCADTSICTNDRLLAQNSDLLIHECSYTKEKNDGGWGHASPEETAKMALENNVRQLILTHFAADEFVTKKQKKAAGIAASKIFKNTLVAFDDKSIIL